MLEKNLVQAQPPVNCRINSSIVNCKITIYELLEQSVSKQIGGKAHQVASKLDSYMKGIVSGAEACLFEELGLYYIGPVDGHNVEDLVYILKNVKAMPAPGPVLIHVITEKGKGYAPAEVASDKMHGECHS